MSEGNSYLIRRRHKLLFSVLPCAPQVVLCCAMGSAFFAYDSALFSGLLINEQFLHDFNQPKVGVLGQMASTFALGSVLGALAVCCAGDISRRLAIIAGCLIALIGIVLEASSFSLAQFIVGRVIAGLGNGLMSTAIPIWLAETFPWSRGKAFAVQLAIGYFGSVIASWINFGVQRAESSFAWRFPIAIQSVFAAVCLIRCLWLPESPRWLISRNRIDESEHVLSLLLKKPVSDGEVQALRNNIEVNCLHERAVSFHRWKDLFNGKSQNLRRVVLGASSQMFQQLSGVSVITYYMAYIAHHYAGFDQRKSLFLSAGNSMNAVLFTFVAMLLIDRVGRRNTAFYGWIGGGLSYTAILVCFIVAGNASTGAVAFLYLYIAVYGLTTNVVPWLYAAEVNSQKCRLFGAALATATHWLFCYLIVSVTPVALSNIDWRYYIIYIVFNCAAAVVAGLFYLETKNHTLEEINELFEQGNGKEHVLPAGRAVDKPQRTMHVEA
ncbi:hexose transporter Hxt10p [Trichomonascus vanleenenianus]|uniref:hexose transporter Hxt10p n=1 Tax=Trichomonascus vanleenenianus TaxID=2268995 RepID=UPI003ECAE564